MNLTIVTMMQLTKFTCGATSVGISWAHVLGDAFSAAHFVNLWGQASRHQYPSQPLSKDHEENDKHSQKSPLKDPLSIKRVGPLGDHWVTPNDTKLDTYSFYISCSELTRLQSKICGDKDHDQIPPFELICTLIWKCIAKVKHGSGVNIVTICKRDPEGSFEWIITNRAQSIKVVKTDSSIEESSPMELGLLIMNQGVDERKNIEEAIEADSEFTDFLVYGANLTFVDLNYARFYDLDIRGNRPVYVNCAIDNVGDEGVVLFFPTQKYQTTGMTISITLLQNHILELKSVLKKEWSLS